MGGKSKKVTVGYWYYATLKAGVALKLDEIFQIKAGDKVALNTRINKNQGNKTVLINNPGLFGGEKAEGGIKGNLEIRWGDENQQPSGLLTRLLGNDIPADRGYVSTVFDGKLTALNPYPKPWSYSVRRYTSIFYPEKSAIILDDEKIYAMNPAHMLWESYTDEDWGSGLSTAAMDETAFRKAADTLYEEKFGLCLAWKVSDELKTFRQQVCDHIGAKVFTSHNGLITIKLIRDDYNVDDLPVFDENTGLLKLDYDATNNTAVPSKVVVTYKDATTFKDRPAMAVNLAVVQSQGNQSVQPIEFKGLPTGDLADRVAHRELKIRTSSLKRYNLEFDRRAFELDIGDPFVLRSLDRKINTIVRVERTEENFLTDGTIKITAIQDLYGLPKVAYNSIPPIENTDPDDTPVVIEQYKLIEVPYRELAGLIDPANLELLDTTISYFFVVAASPKGACRNYNLVSRIRGNNDFIIAEPAGDWCPTAVTVNELGYLDKVINITDGMLLEDVEKGTAAIINDEIVRIDAIDLVNNKITIARGCVDTVPHKHPANSTIWFYDGFETSDFIEYNPSLLVDFKLLSNTYTGQLELSKAPTETLAVIGRQGRPYPPANVKINGLNYPEVVNNFLTVSWVGRNRLLQADQLIDTTVNDTDAEDGTTYNLNFIVNSEIAHSVTGLTSSFYTWDTETSKNVDYALMQFENNLNDEAGNNWTPTGTPVYTDGIVQNKAIRFNSIGGLESLFLTSNSNLNFENNIDFTIEFWFRLTDKTNNYLTVLSNYITSWSGSQGRFIMIYGNSTPISNLRGRLALGGYNLGSNNNILLSKNSIVADTWTHCTITRKGNVFTLYINGVAESSYTGNIVFNFGLNGTVIGRNFWDTGNSGKFTGDLDQLRISRGCLYDSDFIPSITPYDYNAGTDLNKEVTIELEAVRKDPSTNKALTSWQKYQFTIRREQ